MPKIKYKVILCKECDVEFLVRPVSNRKEYYCPLCADNFTEIQIDIWMNQTLKYKRPWTIEDDQLIVTTANAGYSNLQIAKELGRSAKAVNNRITQLRKKGIEIPDRRGGRQFVNTTNR